MGCRIVSRVENPEFRILLIIRVGFGGVFYDNYKKEPPKKPILVIKAPT